MGFTEREEQEPGILGQMVQKASLEVNRAKLPTST
jgi:hypothetical protein